jgi:hypothetical protein
VRVSGEVRGALLLGLFALAGCRERAEALFRFDASMPAPPPPRAEEPHQVRFTYSAPDAVTFRWQGSAGTLRYWSGEIPPRTIHARPPALAPVSSAGPGWEAVADGLVPGKEYQYEVGSPYRPTTQTFRAPLPRGAAGGVFVAVGQMGSLSDTPATAAVNRLLRIAEPSFVLVLGGGALGAGADPTSADRHLDEVMLWSRKAAYMPVWGGGEATPGSADDLRNYEGRFALPHAAAAVGAPPQSAGMDWYWFDQGRVRIIVYPEPYTARTWRAWADSVAPIFAAAEADPALRFIVTAGHRAAYASTVGGGNLELRAILDGLGKRFPKYVLNVAGESRAYERSTPQAHVVHVNAGIGGAPLAVAATACGWPDCALPAFTAFRVRHHGLVKIIVRETDLRIEAICAGQSPGEEERHCADGEIMDSAAVDAGGVGEAQLGMPGSPASRRRMASAASSK